jgi:hypothetical protein
LSAGLRKLNWGKADSDGPLDVINPHDYSDLSEVIDYAGIKIARPLVHAVWNAGDFIKVEGVLVPWFAGHTFADSGRWKPQNISKLEDMLGTIPGITEENKTIQNPDGASLSYFQAGARASATIGGADMALQYYYGYLPRPAVEVKLAPAAPSIPVGASLVYNRFHQAGADFAAVIAGFNLRAEAAFNITEDTEGSDPSVYNPFFHWSLGFDRAFAGFDLNLQCAEKIRLVKGVSKKISLAPFAPDLETDIEAEIPSTLTRVTARVSRVFFRDALTLKFTTLWDIEDSASLLVPSVTLKKGDIEFEISCGIFAGRGNGELGQYRDNGFAKALVTWVF